METESMAKSKGGDYRHLIAEAQSHSQQFIGNSMDDVFSDEFSRSFASMLSLKSEAVLAWSADYDFLGDTASNPQVPFLSLNLNVLAEQLESIDLCESLFIDKDLLPPDLRPQNPVALAADKKASEPVKLEAELEKLLNSFGFPEDDDDDAAHQHKLDDVPNKAPSPSPPPASTSSSSNSNSKVLDDFESWLDTL